MNDLVARLLGAASLQTWYLEHRTGVRRWRERVPTTWLTELSLEDAITRATRGQVDWLERGLGQGPPSIAPARLPSAARAAGASLRVHRIHTLDPRIREVALAFLAAFGEEISVNAYASPPGATGLASHTDPYDVFVLHTAGTKRWFLEGREGEAPIPYAEATGGTHGELVLEPGDLLFLPAHMRHRAQVLDGPSLHLTLSVQVKSPRSLVEWLATELDDGGSEPAWLPRRAQDDVDYAPSVAALRRAALAQLDATACARWLRYREGVEYERTLASFADHRATAARRYR